MTILIMSEKHKNWIECIEDRRLSKDKKARIIEYITQLEDSGFPIVWDLNHLGGLIGVEPAALARMVNGQESFYRYFVIPKRRGGVRELAAPYPALLGVQQWILANILKNVESSQFSHGFLGGRSIITNATMHLRKNHLLKMDLKDFFPSITLKRVISVFRYAGYEHGIAVNMSLLCTLNGGLPQGAPTSPQLSNIIAKRLDRRLGALAKRWTLAYTRYADDLTFSGNYISRAFIGLVSEIIENEQFVVNDKKTVLVRGKGKKIVTGISVSGDSLKLPKTTRRVLRQEIHHLTMRGFEEHAKNRGIIDPMYVDRLLGKLAFWRQIEPDNPFVLSGIKKVREVQKWLDAP